MYYKTAWEIIRKRHLIPRDASKQILASIVKGVDVDDTLLRQYSSHAEIDSLRKDFEQKRGDLMDRRIEISPRNLPFYYLIQDRVPGFKWQVTKNGDTNGACEVQLVRPFVDGLLPSLTTMLLRNIPEGTTSALHGTYRSAHSVPQKIVNRLAALFEEHRFVSPTESEMEDILAWLDRGANGEELTVLTPLCPDYHADKIGENLYRFTFDGIGDQVGVVGKRWLAVFPDIMKMFHELGIKPRVIAAIGDFEGFPDGALKRLNTNWNEFEKSLRRSQEALKSKCDFEVETPVFTELCGGRDKWEEVYFPIRDRLLSHDYGNTGLTEPELLQIAQARKPLYRRWMQIQGDFDFMKTLILQGAEYATMGMIAKNSLSNALILGADHSRMAPFYRFTSDVPVLYMRNNYVNVR